MTNVRVTTSEPSMRTCCSPMSAASQGAFVVIPEISLRDISYMNEITCCGLYVVLANCPFDHTILWFILMVYPRFRLWAGIVPAVVLPFGSGYVLSSDCDMAVT